VWGVIGTIPERVIGRGVLMSAGHVFSINSPAGGMVKNVFIKNGDRVKSGQIIARIQRDDLLDQLQMATQNLEDLQEEYRSVLEYSTGSLALTEKKLSTSKSSLELQRLRFIKQRNAVAENVENLQGLFDEGLVTNQQLLAAKNELNSLDAQLQEVEIRLADLNVSKLQVSGENRKQLLALEQRVEEARKNIEILQISYRNQTKVVSNVTGLVFEVSVNKGDYVGQGTTIAIVEPEESSLKTFRGVVYFNAEDGKKIRRGMNIAISPSTVKQEEYGYILGIVTEVSDFPVTSQYIQNTFHHQGLSSSFAKLGVPIEVKADIIPDPRTPSGYKWSSSRGPAMKIDSGILCTAFVTVRSQRPISLLIPLIKKRIFGVGDDTLALTKAP
jgi:HlyD family secretion protein